MNCSMPESDERDGKIAYGISDVMNGDDEEVW